MPRERDINWNHVFYFSEIASAGSLKVAAERLGLSSSTLSEHLGQLESDLDVRLFQRQHRRLTLTHEGAKLFQYARQMFETGRRFIDVISPLPIGAYPVSIGIVPGASYGTAHKIVSRFIAKSPGASINIVRCLHDELEHLLLESKLDFGFTDRRAEKRGLVQTELAASDVRFFVSASTPQQSLRELLRDMPLLLCRAERRAPSAVEQVLDSLDITPTSVIVSEFPRSIEELCRAGAGVAAVGKAYLEDDPGLRMLRLPKEFPALTERLYVTWVVNGENAEAIRALKSQLGEVPR